MMSAGHSGLQLLPSYIWSLHYLQPQHCHDKLYKLCSQAWCDSHNQGLRLGGPDEWETELTEGFLPGQTQCNECWI